VITITAVLINLFSNLHTTQRTQHKATAMFPEKPPRHSAQAIGAKRVGGKKVPKQYRKYHKNHKNNSKTGGNVATKFAHNLIRGVKSIIESL